MKLIQQELLELLIKKIKIYLKKEFLRFVHIQVNLLTVNEIFVDIKEGIPPLINDIKLVPKVIENEIDILCENNIIIKNQSSLGAEDFTYFLEKTRGVFFNLGYSNKKLNSPIHTSTFNIYEN